MPPFLTQERRVQRGVTATGVATILVPLSLSAAARPTKFGDGRISMGLGSRARSDVAGAGGDAYVSGAFHYDLTNGNNGNNGILSGETGSGTTLNGQAGTGARQTAAQLVTDLENGRYSPGDLIYLSEDDWVMPQVFVVRSNSTTIDANNKVVIRSKPGERARIDLSTNNLGNQGSGANPIHNLDANIVWQRFTVRAPQGAFSSGGLSGQGSGTSHGCEWLDIVMEQVGTPWVGDNGGFWKIQGNSEGFKIAGCRGSMTGNSGGTTNQALLYYIGVTTGEVGYNDFEYDGGPGPVIHHKRSIGIAAIGDILVHKNLLRRVGGGGRVETFHGAGTARHRLAGNIHYGAGLAWGDSGTLGSTMDPPCWEIELEHETFPSTALALWRVMTGTTSGEDCSIRNSLLASGIEHWSSGTAPPVQHTGLVSDYNHGPSGTFMEYFDTLMTLAQWQANASGDTGQDANSVAEAIQYATTPDPTDVTTFRLAAGSAGKNAASDGTDMGADVDDCGPDAVPASYLWLNGTTKVAA